MKLLLVSPELDWIHNIFPELKFNPVPPGILPPDDPGCFFTNWGEHELYLLKVSPVNFELSCRLSAVLKDVKFHLVLFLGRAWSVSADLKVGDLVNVVNDRPGDFGQIRDGQFQDIYDLQWLLRADFPHHRGALVNKNTAYFNLFNPIRKVAACTLNVWPNQETSIAAYSAKYPFELIVREGAAYQYVCLYHRVVFYQLRIVMDAEAESLPLYQLGQLREILLKL